MNWLIRPRRAAVLALDTRRLGSFLQGFHRQRPPPPILPAGNPGPRRGLTAPATARVASATGGGHQSVPPFASPFYT